MSKHRTCILTVAVASLLALVCGVLVQPRALAQATSPAAQPATQPSAAEPAYDLPPTVVTGSPTAAAPVPAAVIRIDGQIDDYNRNQLKLRFDRAKAAGAKVIILEIDTYGGLVSSGLDISRFLKNQQDVKVIGFVNSKAISAGAMIALACHEIVMTPSGTLGDCAPIQVAPGGGAVSLGETERSKIESPILADFRESAQMRGYSPLLAVAMVSLPYEVYWVQNDAGERRFVDADEYKKLTATEDWQPVPGAENPVDGANTLLTVHTEQALEYGLATGTAVSAEDLAAQRGLTVVERYASGAGDEILALLGHPITRMILLIVFINALFIGLKTPGTGAAELIAVMSLGILLGVPLLTGYAEWWQVAMILGGVALIFVDIFLLPGTFLAMIAGGLLLLTGLVFTFVGDAFSLPGGWELPKSWDALETGVQVTVVGLFISVLLGSWLRQYLPKLPYLNRLILPAGDGPAEPETVVAPGVDEKDRWPFIGTVGVAVSDLKPGGSARFPYADDTRLTSVVSQSGYIPAGTKLVVREVRGSYVAVRAAT